jgi:hypothetical protein
MAASNRTGSSTLIAMGRNGESRPRRMTRYLQLCHKTRTVVTLDDQRQSVQAFTVGDNWILVSRGDKETWIDFADLRPEWQFVRDDVRLTLCDECSLILEEGSEAYWLSSSGTSITMTGSGIPNQRRGWRNLQLRARSASHDPVTEVPYLAPGRALADEACDIVFLGPVYFSDAVRLGDIGRGLNDRAGAVRIKEWLPLLAAGIAASSTLAISLISQARDPDLRARILSVALSDAAAIAAVLSSLQLIEVYADSLKSCKGRSIL